MDSTEKHAFLNVALRAADASREAILRRYRAGFSVATKADASPVTEADREAEQAIKDVILAAFPAHRVVGEELGSEGEGELCWLIDPIDGTVSFVHHVPLFATLIALRRASETLLAVVDLPALGRRMHALAGGGAWEDGRRLQVLPRFDPRDSLICRGDRRQFERSGRLELYQRLETDAGLCRAYTDAFGHCLVAAGAAGLMVDPDLRPWDIAAPALLVREAGGMVLEIAEPALPGKTSVISGSRPAVTWAQGLLEACAQG